MPALIKQPLAIALAFSLALHALVLFEIGFKWGDPRKFANSLQPLQVVLVNARSKSSPTNADALAQYNLDGGGNTPEDRVAKNPFPALGDDKQFTPEESAQRVQQLEQEAKRILIQSKSTFSVAQEKTRRQQETNERASGEDLVQHSMEIARLEAQINKDFDAYQKMPRRRFIGATTREYRDAQYIEAWRIKVERIGTLNYPEMARQKRIYGSLQLTIEIRSDGSVESAEISRSSGQPILDAAALRIVKLASPFSPFPPDIRRDTDILSITRTWSFTQSDKLESE